MIRGTSDFFGLNHYTTVLCSSNFDPDSIADVGYDQDREAGTEQDYTWNNAASVWLKEVRFHFVNLQVCKIRSPRSIYNSSTIQHNRRRREGNLNLGIFGQI